MRTVDRALNAFGDQASTLACDLFDEIMEAEASKPDRLLRRDRAAIWSTATAPYLATSGGDGNVRGSLIRHRPDQVLRQAQRPHERLWCATATPIYGCASAPRAVRARRRAASAPCYRLAGFVYHLERRLQRSTRTACTHSCDCCVSVPGSAEPRSRHRGGWEARRDARAVGEGVCEDVQVGKGRKAVMREVEARRR